MKPLLNKLSPPPTKHDRDYYSKLDLYLKNLYEFTQQINDTVAWIELKAQENEERDTKLAELVKDIESKLCCQQSENNRVLQEVVRMKSAVNFKGSWSTLSGVVNVPAVVYHKDKYWNLVRAVRRVEAQEPSFSDVWVEV